MTTTVKITTASHPVNVTQIHKQATGNERSSTEKLAAGQTREIHIHDSMAVRIDELPYELPPQAEKPQA